MEICVKYDSLNIIIIVAVVVKLYAGYKLKKQDSQKKKKKKICRALSAPLWLVSGFIAVSPW